jgi:hypothetical protein
VRGGKAARRSRAVLQGKWNDFDNLPMHGRSLRKVVQVSEEIRQNLPGTLCANKNETRI